MYFSLQGVAFFAGSITEVWPLLYACATHCCCVNEVSVVQHFIRYIYVRISTTKSARPCLMKRFCQERAHLEVLSVWLL